MSSPAGWSTSSLSKVPSREPASDFGAPKSSPRLTAPLSRIWREADDVTLYTRLLCFLLPALVVLATACGGGDNNKGIGITTQAPSRAATPETRTPIGVPPVEP